MTKAVKTAREEGRKFPVPQKVLDEANAAMMEMDIPKGGKKAAKERAQAGIVLSSQTGINKLISLLWKHETKEVRKKYDDLSALRKQEVSFLF